MRIEQEEKRDFEEAKRGFIAAPPYRKIMDDKGGVAWDMDNAANYATRT
jgi:alkyl sulfatase BDS1-like metallo-beta-lactamase superfamily hydrolase